MSNINLPNLATCAVIEKREDGKYYWTPEYQGVMGQFFQQLKKNYSNQGLFAPEQKTTAITDLNIAASKGAILYDADTDEFKGNVNGTFKTFTLT